MSSTVTSLLTAAGLEHGGVVGWGTPVPQTSPGVYLVTLDADPASTALARRSAPVNHAQVEKLLDTRCELRLDGERPTVGELAERLACFWLPDETVLYIGLAGTSVRSRVRGYYTTPIGARKPHAGGWFLKTLANIGQLHVHYAPTATPATAENTLLNTFVASVSQATRECLSDPAHPFPFANLEWPSGIRKQHGITGARGDINKTAV